jgi:hypothetical protein
LRKKNKVEYVEETKKRNMSADSTSITKNKENKELAKNNIVTQKKK